MKYPHSIPLWHTNGEPVPGGNRGRVVLSSASTKWNDIVLEQRHVPSTERADVMYKRHVIAINIGHSFTWEFEKDGRFHRIQMARGTISFCPSHQPFSHVTLRRSKHPELTSDFLRVPKITDINMSLSIRPLLKKKFGECALCNTQRKLWFWDSNLGHRIGEDCEPFLEAAEFALLAAKCGRSSKALVSGKLSQRGTDFQSRRNC
jgi:hypothetical protein